MPTTKRPQGLEASRKMGSGANSLGVTRYRVGASAPSAIAMNDPVAITGTGTIAPATATTDYILGVAAGFQYVDSNTKKPTWAKSVAAGTSSYDSNLWIDVVDDPEQKYIVVADATVSWGDVGLNYELSGVGVPDTNGRSTAVLKASSRTSAAKAVQVVGPYNLPDNNFGSDAYPYVEVRIVQNRSARLSAN